MPTNNKMVSYAILNPNTSVVVGVGVTDWDSIEVLAKEETIVYPVPDEIVHGAFRYDWDSEAFVSLPSRPEGVADWDGETWVIPDTTESDLVDCKSFGIYSVNQEVGNIRSKYITRIDGQEMLYLEKEREAVAFLSDTKPKMSDYPFITKEVGKTATTAQELAQVWLNKSFILRQKSAELEGYRFEAINAIRVATTRTAVEDAIDKFKSNVSKF